MNHAADCILVGDLKVGFKYCHIFPKFQKREYTSAFHLIPNPFIINPINFQQMNQRNEEWNAKARRSSDEKLVTITAIYWHSFSVKADGFCGSIIQLWKFVRIPGYRFVYPPFPSSVYLTCK